MTGALAIAVFATACLSVSPYVMAFDRDEWPENRLLSEIILTPQQGNSKTANKASSAAEQRDKARAYQRDDVSSGNTTIIVLPEEEGEGILFPRGNAPPERARENRSRASDYQHGTDSSLLPGFIKPDTGIPVEGGSTQDRAHENRARASAYSRGETPTGLTGRVGPDGIPLAVCKDRDNVAGQIGDDLKSGSVIVILRDGKQVKVRCQ